MKYRIKIFDLNTYDCEDLEKEVNEFLSSLKCDDVNIWSENCEIYVKVFIKYIPNEYYEAGV